MPVSNTTKPNFKTLWIITFGATLIWTVMLIGLLVGAIDKETKHVIDLALKEARTNFNKDLAMRHWITSRGGVYVEVEKGASPSPYLAQIPDRDIETPAGKRLTLLDPSTLLRQVMEEFSDLYGVKGRLISLNPLNPVNRADAWESEVFNRFQKGAKEVSEVSLIGGDSYLRYMQPLTTREGCLKCHVQQDFKVGTVSGGISVSVPMLGFTALKEKKIETLKASFGAIWLLGLFSIVMGNGYSRRQIRQRWRADQALTDKSRQLQQERQLFITGPTVVIKWRLGQGWPVEYVSPNIKELLGYTKEELEAGEVMISDLIHADDLLQVKAEINAHSKALKDSFEQEFRLRHKDGQYLWLYDLTNIIRDDDGEITHFHGYILDISERKQTLERLAKNELKYRSVVDNAHEGFWLIDRDLTTLEVNDSLCTLLGYPREEMLGKTPMDFVDQENRKIFQDQTRKIPYTEHRIYDIALRHKCGSKVYTHFTTTTLRDNQNEVVGAFAFVSDQTPQKEVEDTLRKTKDRLAFALDGAQEGFWDWQVQTGEVYFSPRMEILLGHQAGDWRPHMDAWKELVHPDDIQRVMALMNDHLVGNREHFRAEYRMRHKDGHYVWIMNSGRVVERDSEGNPIRAVGTHVDISERKAMEHALAASQASLAEAQRIAKTGNWELDLIKNDLIWSDQIYRIFEVDRKTFNASYEGFLEVIHPDDREVVNRAYTESLVSGKPYEITHRLLMKDGRIKYVHEICETHFDESGKPIASHGTVQDVTEYHQAKLDLIAAKERAEAATRDKSDFLATMSHEIRTPMNGLIGMAELLSDSKLDGTQRDSVEVIRKSGQMLLDIINDILDFSKLDARQVELESIPFNLEIVCHNVMELIAPQANDKGLELVLDFQPDCPRMMHGDPGRLRQVLLNLVGNALKFTEEGFVRLKVRSEDSKSGKLKLCLSVEDTGIGIDPAKQDKLFEAFIQADQATTRKYGGTGLGLSISRKLIHLMDGEISVESTPDKGSIFKVEMQLSAVSMDPFFPAMEMEGVRLLFLDQSKQTAKALLPLFEYLGIQALVLHDKVDVIPHLHNAVKEGAPFHMAFLDQPKYASDGVVLGQAIRSLPELTGLRLVALTNLGHRGDAAYFSKAGFDAYLNKPLNSTTIVKVIRSLMDKNEAGEQILTRYSIENETESRIDAQQFKGRVLLVEDVHANQKVASTMLRNLGVRVDVAENGLHALIQWKAGTYDLIFMDCRMPEMDGYQATRMIRQQEKGKMVPIVALTANATPRDRQRCMLAGMNDIITKPFSKADLANALKRWIGNVLISEQSTQPEAKTFVSLTQKVIDFNVLEKLKLDMGDEFRIVFDAIHQNIAEILERLESEVQSLPADEVARLVHSLKSPSANIGAAHLYEMATEFEKMADQGELEDASERLFAMKLEYQQILKAFREKGF